jgi:F-type H+-transporting ATPase subunit O
MRDSTPALKTHSHSTQVNSDILGGLVVEIGDRTIDLSVSGRIAKMNKLLTDTL